MMRRFRRISLAGMMAAVAVVAVLGAFAARWYHSHGPLPLNQSVYLRKVAEPIAMVDAMGFADGGSVGLRFVDARKVAWDICLEDTRMLADDPKVLEGSHNVIINSFLPTGPDAHRAPVSGVEERVLLGLLERWSARRSAKSTGAVPPADRAAMYILAELRKRN